MCNLGLKPDDFHSHGMKVWASAEICYEHPAALGKKYHPLLVVIPALPTCTVEQTGPQSTVSGKVFLLLNVNIDLPSLIKLSGYFSLHNLDKKTPIPPRLRREPLALFVIWCRAVVVALPGWRYSAACARTGSCSPPPRGRSSVGLSSRWQTLLGFGTGAAAAAAAAVGSPRSAAQLQFLVFNQPEPKSKPQQR